MGGEEFTFLLMEENRIAQLGDTSEIGELSPEDNGTDNKNDTAPHENGEEDCGKGAERREYERLIKTRFKDFYTEDTQRMINRRFKSYKALEEKCKSLEDELLSYAATTRTSDVELLEKNKAGEGEIKEKYSDFSPEEAYSSEKFMSLARLAVEGGEMTLCDAYRLSFFDKLILAERERAESEAEQRIHDRIRANRSRAVENAMLPRALTRGFSAAQLTREERAALAKRAANGEKIGF